MSGGREKGHQEVMKSGMVFWIGWNIWMMFHVFLLHELKTSDCFFTFLSYDVQGEDR